MKQKWWYTWATFLTVASAQQYGADFDIDESKHDQQFFKFLSRPDIDAPIWDIKVYNESALAPGYFFVSPYGKVEQETNDKPYVGPHIYDSTNGELVWSGAPMFERFDTFTFKLSKYKDNEWISLLHPKESHGVVMDEEYRIRRHIRVGINHHGGNMHEFQVINNGESALYLTSNIHRTSRENSLKVGFDGRCRVAFPGFEERRIDSEEVVFEWMPENKIALEESYMYNETYSPTHECAHSNWDYTHLNSVDKLPDGDYLLSGKRVHAVYKISHKDGSIVWRLGGKNSDFTFEDDTVFSGQHDVRLVSYNKTHTVISMMDNAVSAHWVSVSNPNSRGLIISLNTETMTARTVTIFDHPWGVGNYAPERGNFQILPNGNAFAVWTNKALYSEHSPDGTVLAEARIISGLKTYRGYKFPWKGHPQAPPDVHSQVVASEDGSVRTIVSVSWNGDTEVGKWNVYQTDVDGKESRLLATADRTGFETPIAVSGYAPFVKVDAIDRDGKKRKESKSHVAETVAMRNREGSIMSIPGEDGSFDGWEADTEDVTGGSKSVWKEPWTNPIVTFFAGILFCCAAGITVWLVLRYWSRCALQRKQVAYAPLQNKEDELEMEENDKLMDEKREAQ